MHDQIRSWGNQVSKLMPLALLRFVCLNRTTYQIRNRSVYRWSVIAMNQESWRAIWATRVISSSADLKNILWFLHNSAAWFQLTILSVSSLLRMASDDGFTIATSSLRLRIVSLRSDSIFHSLCFDSQDFPHTKILNCSRSMRSSCCNKLLWSFLENVCICMAIKSGHPILPKLRLHGNC